MSKKSRGFQPERSASAEASEVPPASSTSGSGRTSRSAARRAERSQARTSSGSVLERYRGLIIAAVALAAVGVVGIFLYQGASAAPYSCETLLTPPPDGADAGAGPAASPGTDEGAGFATEDLGRGHVATGASISYAFCPPTSGEHWSDGSRSPLRRDVYAPGDSVSPGNWVHNLEHGYVVLIYRGDPGPDVMAQIREAVDAAPAGPMSEVCGLPNKVIAVRFDDLAEGYDFAAIAWDRALLMSEWDSDAAMAFAGRWQDSPQAPEEVC